jgi:hypothetical protein
MIFKIPIDFIAAKEASTTQYDTLKILGFASSSDINFILSIYMHGTP